MDARTFNLLNSDFNNLNFNILENGLFHGDHNWSFNDVVSSFNRMYFVISGNACIENDSTKYQLEPGKIYLIPAGSKNNYCCTSEVHKFYLHFQIHLLPGIDLFQGLEDVLACDYTEELLEQIIHHAENASLTDLLHLKSIFTSICARFYADALSRHNLLEKQSGFYRQERILHYVSENLTSKLRISDMAEYFNVPFYQLTREFKQDTGITLKEYIEKQLLHKSKNLLLNSNCSITQIAEQLEFCDAYYFSRFFRKFELESPKEYRRLKRKN